MIVPVFWKSYHQETPNRGYWDMGIIEHIFSKEIWNPVGDYEFEHHDDFDSVFDYGIVVIPARYHAKDIDQINSDLAKLRWCILILAGDEEATFPVEKINHPRIKTYVMTPNFDRHKSVDGLLGDGWPPDAPELIKVAGLVNKSIDWFFAGQITHTRRQQCKKALVSIKKDKKYTGHLVETEKFTEGLPHQEYYNYMASAKVAPCPSGPETPDTFRFYEALESGCVPIADDKTRKDDKRTNYWRKLFGDDIPFPVITDWRKLKGVMVNMIDRYPAINNKIFAWWQLKKRELAYQITDDINYLAETESITDDLKDLITVLIPTSPIINHPDTSMIEETISTIRERLPNSEIILMIDGVRDEQKKFKSQYDEYVRRLLWGTNFVWHNVVPLFFEEHKHQAAMTREALKLARTPTIMFVEHDAPLCQEIPFKNLIETVRSGEANMIRLHHEALILDVHKHMMLDKQPITIHGIPLVRTSQWSQRPHVASTEFYRQMIDKYFEAGDKTMIEDIVHSPLMESYKILGKAGWNNWKVWIYAPEGDMKRSYHTDGRGAEPKYKMFVKGKMI